MKLFMILTKKPHQAIAAFRCCVHRKRFFFLSLWVACFSVSFSSCTPEKTPGIGYSPLAGTWQLIHRNVLIDSILIDTVLTNTVLGDSIKTDTVVTRSVLTIIRTIRIETPASQTLTFGADGSLSSAGEQTSYYRSARAYRVDSTRQEQRIAFLPGSIYAAFYQSFLLRADSLTLLPCPDRACDLLFVKAR